MAANGAAVSFGKLLHLWAGLDAWMNSMRGHEGLQAWGDAHHVIRQLEGAWTLERTVDDRPLLRGRATFEATEAATLAYAEQGVMRLADGREFEVTRRYLFQASLDGFLVFFAETPLRLFHAVVLTEADGGLNGHAHHVCGEDRYDSQYQFRTDGTFTIGHAVIGPRKRYALQTLYRRNTSPRP